MDVTKTFDIVRHSVLFGKLMNQKLSAILIWLLMRMYTSQYANVCWNGKRSCHFTMNNGVKQGAVLSAILYCIYVNDLLREKLREKKTGCWINGDFVGIVG